MNFIDRLFGKDKNVTKADPFSAAADRHFVFMSGGTVVSPPNRNGDTVAKEGFDGNPVVHACVQSIVNVAGGVPFEVYTVGKDGAIEVVPQSELGSLLNRPSVSVSSIEFRNTTFVHLLIYGNAYWWIKRKNGKPYRLDLIHPTHVQSVIREQESGDILAYKFLTKMNQSVTAPVDDVVHFRDLSVGVLNDFGFPRAAAAISEIVTDNEANSYIRQLLKNNGAPGIVVSGEATPEELKIAEQVWNEKMNSREGRGKTVFVPSNVKVDVVGFNLQNLEFVDLRAITREGICASFGIDPRMVGIGSAGQDAGLSGTQYWEARSRLIQHTILPLMEIIVSQVNNWLASEYGNYYVRFDQKCLNKYIDNPADVSTRITNEYKSGVRGLGESREALGLPRQLTEGDTLYSPPVVGVPTNDPTIQ